VGLPETGFCFDIFTVLHENDTSFKAGFRIFIFDFVSFLCGHLLDQTTPNRFNNGSTRALKKLICRPSSSMFSSHD